MTKVFAAIAIFLGMSLGQNTNLTYGVQKQTKLDSYGGFTNVVGEKTGTFSISITAHSDGVSSRSLKTKS